MNNGNLKKLGNNISQEKLAEMIGKTRNYVGMVERAELNISAKAIFDFANALQVEAKTFFEF